MDITNFVEDKNAGKIQVIVMKPDEVQIIADVTGPDGKLHKEAAMTSPFQMFQSRHLHLEEIARLEVIAAAEKVAFDELVGAVKSTYPDVDPLVSIRESWPLRFAKDFPEVIAAEKAQG